jgi:HK97 gp10 family phage protein
VGALEEICLIEAKLKGFDDLLKNLEIMKTEAGLKGARTAGRKAAIVIRDAAIENAKQIDDPQSAEDISKNIVVQFGKAFANTGDVTFRVGVMGGAKTYANTKGNVRAGKAGKSYATGGDKSNPGGDTFYWRFIEFGTSKLPARPFMLPALRDNIGKATQVFITEYDKILERTAKKLKKNEL